jgi:uncharacterized protein (TIGR02996 family)
MLQSLEDAFLAAIIDAPGEDAPRLASADWLQEQDDPERAARGEFIVLQYARERAPWDRALQASEDQLLRDHAPAWLGVPWEVVQRCSFRRGFVEAVAIDAVDFLAHAETLFRRHPIRSASFGISAEEHLVELAASPWLARLTDLDMRGYDARYSAFIFHPGRASQFFASPHLGSLTALRLGCCWQGVEVAEELARSPSLRRLEVLELRDCWVGRGGDGMASALAGWSRLAGLAELDLTDDGIGDLGVVALVESARLSGLRVLRLGSNGIGDVGACALACSPHLAGLHTLELHGNMNPPAIGDRGARALARSPYLAGLARLDVSWCALGAAGKAALRDRFGDRVNVTDQHEGTANA